MLDIVQLYTNNQYRNFNYIVIYNENKAIVIDPYDPKQILDFLNERDLELEYIINTHEHFDHTCGNEDLKSKTSCKVLVGEPTKGRISEADEYLKEEQEIFLEKNSYLKVIFTPGHTPGHICLQLFIDDKMHCIFTGDTLFNAGVGNCNSGNPEELYKTITEKFKEVNDKVLIYPGHDYWENNLGFAKARESDNGDVEKARSDYEEMRKLGHFLVSTMGRERKINPFLRLNSQCIIEGLRERCNLNKKPNEKEVFLSLRRIRDKW